MRNSVQNQDVIEIAFSPEAPRLLGIATAAIVSLVVGIGIGLIVAWGFWPVEYFNADPSDLRQRYKDDYLRMISATYVADGNLDKARERLKQLGTNLTATSFSELIAREQRAGRDTATLDAMALLAQALSSSAIAIPARTAVPDTTVSNNPAQNAQPIPSFQLTERTMLTCSDDLGAGRLQFIVHDAQGGDLPNIAIDIRWSSGEDTVYTGLKPERGAGYADLDAPPGNYSVTVANAQSDVAENLVIGELPANCRNDRGRTPRGWRLVFQQK